jgi:hypothetical protein
MKTLIVKLRNEVSPERGLACLRSLVGTRDLEAARQLFPGDTEPETASLVEVRLRSSAAVGHVLETLQAAAEVEYAHEPAARKPCGGGDAGER